MVLVRGARGEAWPPELAPAVAYRGVRTPEFAASSVCDRVEEVQLVTLEHELWQGVGAGGVASPGFVLFGLVRSINSINFNQ